MRTVKKLIFILLILFMPCVAIADTHYMATTGSDSGTCTSGSPCLTLRYAITQMAGGDTLTIADGTYSGSGNLIDGNNLPPSGSAGNFTTIRATNIPCEGAVACNQALKVIFPYGAGIFWDWAVSSSYVKVQGIHFKSGVGTMNADHWYFKQCAVQGDDQNGTSGNTSKWAFANSTYILVEDSIAYGRGRYGFLWYDSNQAGAATYSVCRRCVHRQDYVSTTMPIGGFNNYASSYLALLNVIDIDGDNTTNYGNSSDVMASFSQVNYTGNANYLVQGSISLNNAKSTFSARTGSTGHTLVDVVGVHNNGGVLMTATVSANRVNLIDIGSDNFDTATGSYVQNNGFIDWQGSSSTINNSIVRDITTAGTSGTFTGDYFNRYSSGTNSFAPAHAYTTDPFSNGLLYPVRIETSGALYTAGSSGGQIGAKITTKIGTDGTFYNDTGYATDTGDNLWPWPYEEWVKAQMAAMDGTIGGATMPSATRGFAATGQTLTKYIWEYLGNTCPVGICTSAPSYTGSLNGGSIR